MIARPTHTSFRHASPRAFTLIELLTVIAIIGILAAILIPTVGKVRYTAKNAQCVSNLREWARSIQLYANENKGYYFTENSGGTWPFTYDYGRYFSSGSTARVRSCPLATSLETDPACYNMVQGSINGNIDTLAPKDKIPLNRVANPSQYLLMADTIRHANNVFLVGTEASLTTLITPLFNPANTGDSLSRHKWGPINGVFADGSIKRITITPAGQGDNNSIFERRTTWFQLN